MCGIIFVKADNKKIALAELLKQYEKQKTRGSEGFGFIGIGKRDIEYKRSAYWEQIEKDLTKAKASEILFHHRYPTSTINIKECAHPIKVEHKELTKVYYVVHNGVITNDDTLKEKHEKLGYKYNTEVLTTYKTSGTEYEGASEYNDSESLAIELARYNEGLSDSIGTVGNVAFIMLECSIEGGPLRLHYGRNEGNPLNRYKRGKLLVLASEGQGQEVEPNEWNEYEYSTGKLKKHSINIGGFTQKVGFADYSKSSDSSYKWDKATGKYKWDYESIDYDMETETCGMYGDCYDYDQCGSYPGLTEKDEQKVEQIIDLEYWRSVEKDEKVKEWYNTEIKRRVAELKGDALDYYYDMKID